MNLHEMNCNPLSKTLPAHQGATATFLTTNLPLAVQEKTKTGHHSSATVSRRVCKYVLMSFFCSIREKVTKKGTKCALLPNLV